MSALSQAEHMRNYISEPVKDRQNGLGILVRWIPGEVVAIYGAAVGLLHDPVGSKAAGITWVVGLGLALLLAFMGSKPWTVSGNKEKTALLLASLVFTAIAFVLWSFTIPSSAGYRWSYAADHTAISALAALAGLGLGAISEGVLEWIRAKVKP